MSESECKFREPVSPTDEKVRAQNREDFMKRWFAIALSVGFATALARMPWVENKLIFMPSLDADWNQINQGLRLCAAGIATLLSWEGYLISIGTKPLIDGGRFYIDVGLVTLYLILLVTSGSQQLWVGIHALAFMVYIFWDFLSIGVYRSTYVLENHDKYLTRTDVYRGILTRNKDIRPGPTVTLVWPIYLVALVSTYYGLFDVDQRADRFVTTLYFVLVLVGLFGYRHSKQDMKSSRNALILRVISYALVAVLAALFVRCVIQTESLAGPV